MAKTNNLFKKILKVQSYAGRIVKISQPAKPMFYIDTYLGPFPCHDGSPLDTATGTLTDIHISQEDIILTVQTQDGEKLWMVQDDTKVVLLS